MNDLMSKPADDPGVLPAAPIETRHVGANAVIWRFGADLIGSIHWGTLDEPSVRDLAALFDLMGDGPLPARQRVLTDARAITFVDGDALIELIARARERLESWSSRIEHQVVVLPTGMPGILLAGALMTIAAGTRLRLVHDLEPAFALLGRPAARAAHDAAAEQARRVAGHSVLLTRLRAVLARDLAGATIERCAADLGLSVRSLQRHLGRNATSFSDELRRARVDAAQELLAHTDSKIEAIAARIGLGTASRLSATLRRELDVTASELRARARAS